MMSNDERSKEKKTRESEFAIHIIIFYLSSVVVTNSVYFLLFYLFFTMPTFSAITKVTIISLKLEKNKNFSNAFV